MEDTDYIVNKIEAARRDIMRTLSDLQGAVTMNSNLLHELLMIHRNQAQVNNQPSIIDTICAKVEETNMAISQAMLAYNAPPTKFADGAGSSAGGSGAGAQGTIAQGSGSA